MLRLLLIAGLIAAPEINGGNALYPDAETPIEGSATGDIDGGGVHSLTDWVNITCDNITMDAAGILLAPPGVTALPGIAGVGDPNSGIIIDGDNVLFSTGGAARGGWWSGGLSINQSITGVTNIAPSGDINMASTSTIDWGTYGEDSAPGDGQRKFMNEAAGAGVCLDVTGDDWNLYESDCTTAANTEVGTFRAKDNATFNEALKIGGTTNDASIKGYSDRGLMILNVAIDGRGNNYTHLASHTHDQNFGTTTLAVDHHLRGWSGTTTGASNEYWDLSHDKDNTVLTSGTGSIKLDDDVIVSESLTCTPSGDQSLSAATEIAHAANAIARVVGNGGAVTLTATPTITAAGAQDGEILRIHGTSDVNTVTLQDNDRLAGTLLEFCDNRNPVLMQGESVTLVYDSGDTKWYEESCQSPSGKVVGSASVTSGTHTTSEDEYLIFVPYTATGAVTVTLASATVTTGRLLFIKDTGNNADVNNITIATEGAETIDGAASATVSSAYGSIDLASDGTNWSIR